MDDAASLKQNKVLTISIAAYNVEKTIGETLRSLVGVKDTETAPENPESANDKNFGEALDSLMSRIPEETIRKMEIIVVNDGSKDGTEKVVGKYVELYPESVILVNKENGGWGSTVNTALSMAKGKYLKLLDGDDWFLTENFPEYIDFLEKAEGDMVLSPFVKRFPDRGELSDCHGEIGAEVRGMEALKPDVDIYMHELAVRTERLREGQVKITEKCFYTDNEFAFEVIKCSDTVQRFGKPIYIYRLGDSEQSVGLSGILKHYKDTVSVAEKMYESYGNMAPECFKEKDSMGKNSEVRDGIKQESEAPEKEGSGMPKGAESKTSAASKAAKDLILRRKLLLITDSLYVSYLLVNSAEAKWELIQFDRELKKKTDIYSLTGENKKIRLLRMTGFLLYGYLAKKVRGRFN